MDRKEYEKLVAAHWSMAVKGAANPYTSMNGNMFSFLDKAGSLAVRLSPEDRVNHNDRYDLGPVTQYGSVMKDYVWVPDALLEDAEDLEELMGAAIRFARSLKPKPTKK